MTCVLDHRESHIRNLGRRPRKQLTACPEYHQAAGTGTTIIPRYALIGLGSPATGFKYITSRRGVEPAVAAHGEPVDLCIGRTIPRSAPCRCMSRRCRLPGTG